MIGIYKITSPSGRVYIGQSRQIEKRLKNYSGAWCKGQVKLYNSIMKYGWINHAFEVIEECLFEELNIKERFWQEHYNCLEEGLNCQYTQTDILPLVLSLGSRINKSLSQKGSIRTEQHKAKISNGLKALNSSHITTQALVKRSGENHWTANKSFTEEHKRKLSESKKGKRSGLDSVRSRIILDMQTGVFYYGINDAALFFNVHYETMCRWLHNPNQNKTYLQIV